MISDLLDKSKNNKLDKRIDEDLTINYNNDEYLEEESKEEKDFLKSPNVFDKKLNIMGVDNLSAKKIKQPQDDIQKMCKSKKLIYKLILIL